MMKKNQNDYIYIVLVKALTGLGKFTRFITKYEYTHIAICLNDELDDFITFSRKKHHAPFDSGFMHETLDCYAFGKNSKVKLKVFKIPVKKESKKQIENYIETISKDNDYLFNFLSMITMPIFHGFKIYKTHNCMTFVSKIIKLSDSINLDKNYYKYSIKEIDNILNNFLYKEEYFVKEKMENKDYMKYISIFYNIWLFLKLNIKLVYRLITKRNDKYE